MYSRSLATHRKVLKWVVIVFGVAFFLAAVLLVWSRHLPRVTRAWLLEVLEKRYECEVELKNFNASLFPVVSIAGEGLILKPKGRSDLPPLAFVRKFSVIGDWRGLVRQPRHFRLVRLEGLAMVVPPRRKQAQAESEPLFPPPARKTQAAIPFVLDEILAQDATLSILSANPGKPPHTFEIHRLRMRSVGLGQPMSFQITLTIPRPVGQVQSSGRFGPWNTDDPSLTAISGNYTFSHADLSTIRGLGGILSSHGSYEGVLSEIHVQGVTDTPDFDLGISGNQVHLKTQFKAVVDGVNGDTLLQPVTAQFLGSKVVARGGVTEAPEGNGRIILLDTSVQPGRLEDFLRLAVKSATPSMTGALSLRTKLDLHPGEEQIVERLKLDGSFTVQAARFTNPETEAKITSLSRRGQGKPQDKDIQNAQSDMQGHFVLANSQLTFSSLSFTVPGASVQLQGTFGLLTQALDFQGTLRLQAKVSQMTSGIKSLLLKAIDPLFEGGGAGTVLPIKIRGTREEPSFQVEIGKALKREE